MFFKNLDCLGAASRRSDGECQGRGRRPQSAEDPVQGVPAADLVKGDEAIAQQELSLRRRV